MDDTPRHGEKAGYQAPRKYCAQCESWVTMDEWRDEHNTHVC